MVTYRRTWFAEPQYWRNQALDTLGQKIKRDLNKNEAKNIIFFLGDGMSIPTITAARIYQGQQQNSTGEENKLYFEKFPYTGLSKVRSYVPSSVLKCKILVVGGM